MIQKLLDAASQRGDSKAVALCKAALDGHYGPREDCATALNNARDEGARLVVADLEGLQWEEGHAEDRREAAGMHDCPDEHLDEY